MRALADARRAARASRDYPTADRLRAEIEASGWRMVDKGRSYRLERLHPPDVVVDRRTRYGWSGAVPSRLAERPVGLASIVMLAPSDPDRLERLLAGLAGAIDERVQRVVVAGDVPPEVETMLVRLEDRDAVEVVWTAGRFGAAAALNAGIRRAAASVVLVLDARLEVLGDVVTPLVEALVDPSLAVAGPWGLVSGDLRRFESAEAGASDVTAIDGWAIAFRRQDYVERGPLDEHFESLALLDAWWSLVLRDEGEGRPPRRASIVEVPLARPEVEAGAGGEGGPDRTERRNRYRIIDRFGHRRDLASPERSAM